MRDEFFIEKHGKRYVLFAGLLDEAHEQGLRSIDTELIQVPSEANGNVAIVKAKVEVERNHGTHEFSGIGDASPDNVGRAIVPHLIRMAETRAKARALRDSVNIGVTALEELGGDDSTNQPTGGRESGKSSGQRQNKSSKPASDSQKNYLRRLLAPRTEEWEDNHKPIDDMTVSEASDAIEFLKDES